MRAIGTHTVETDQKAIIDIPNRHEIRYREGTHVLSIETEMFVSENRRTGIIVYLSYAKRWVPPCQNETIEPGKREQIQKDLHEALLLLEVAHRFE
jgi:hypothetical protein